jgi:uncharacterized repeat protein (TIGR03803 family)
MYPVGGVALSGTTLYGMTNPEAAQKYGNIFSVGIDGSNYRNLVSFTGAHGTAVGAYPYGSLTVSGSTLYGMTQGGGAGFGNVFSLGTDGTKFQNLVSFTGLSGTASGYFPYGSLTLGGSTLYGMTSEGGANLDGNIFSVGTDGSSYRNLLSFTGTGGAASGYYPYGSLTLGGTMLYGMTQFGSVDQGGNVFSIGTDGTNFRNLVSLYQLPIGSLTLNGAKLFGTYPGTYGAIFSVGVDGTGYGDLTRLTGTSGTALGRNPEDLTLSGTTLYGMTEAGGTYDAGTIFSVGVDGKGFQTLYSFTDGADGADPIGDLTLSGGTLFGVTSAGGASGYGTVFALTLPVPEPGTLALVGAMFLAGCLWRRRWRRFAIIAAIALLPSSTVRADVFNMPNGQTSITMVPVGNPGNAPDPATGNLYGSVSYNYNIDKYDVTNDQYCAFLNMKATNGDPLQLWNSNMSSDADGGVNQSGTGTYTYTVKVGQGSQPVVDVTWFDAIRFINWLDNGQGNGNTETGAYTLLGGTTLPSNASAITRNPGAQWFLPSENEWYKAAYYDPSLNVGAGGYWSYPFKSNTATWELSTAAGPNSGNNTANFYSGGFALTGGGYVDLSVDYLTNVGAYPLALSAYNTLDQGGDAAQWNETLIDSTERGVRGGSWGEGSIFFASSHPGIGDYDDPGFVNYGLSFRVASSVAVPEPGTLALLAVGGVALLCRVRRRRAGPPAASGGPVSYRPSGKPSTLTGYCIS